LVHFNGNPQSKHEGGANMKFTYEGIEYEFKAYGRPNGRREVSLAEVGAHYPGEYIILEPVRVEKEAS
jgi:hypothetical protein